MDDEGSTDDGLRTQQADLVVYSSRTGFATFAMSPIFPLLLFFFCGWGLRTLTGEADLGDTASIGGDVTQVSDVPAGSETIAVVYTGRVEVGTSGGAAVAVRGERLSGVRDKCRGGIEVKKKKWRSGRERRMGRQGRGWKTYVLSPN